MAYDLYIDVLFLMNFLMDTLLLWTLRKILKYRGSPLRLFSGGLVGALWACAAALCPGMPPAARAAGTSRHRRPGDGCGGIFARGR